MAEGARLRCHDEERATGWGLLIEQGQDVLDWRSDARVYVCEGGKEGKNLTKVQEKRDVRTSKSEKMWCHRRVLCLTMRRRALLGGNGSERMEIIIRGDSISPFRHFTKMLSREKLL